MASGPSFDPNLFVRGIDSDTWAKITSSEDHPLQNRSLTGQYPPGSVFKIVVALAALEEGVIRPDERLTCDGKYPFSGRTFHCWKEHGHGTVNFYRALKESCDIYFYKVGNRLGVDRIARYAKKLGLGRRAEFDAGREKAGLIPTTAWKLKRFGVPWQAGETISASIGQSYILVTPIQMANLISAVFNGGKLYKPQATKWVGKKEGDTIYEFNPALAGNLKIDPDHLELVKRALIGVVNEPRGTGSKARLEHTIVAGKTGTAQVVALEEDEVWDKNRKVPLEHRDHAWFVAIAPAENPKIALAIVVEHGGHGGSAAAPIAKEMIDTFLGVGWMSAETGDMFP
jgi:penicillin-binding protein 2